MEILVLLALLDIQLVVNPPECKEPFAPAGTYHENTITVCEKPNVDSRLTIRHELIHHAQACLDTDLIFLGEDYLYRDFPYLAYDPEEWDGEAEARVLANELSNEQLEGLLTWACPTYHVEQES